MEPLKFQSSSSNNLAQKPLSAWEGKSIRAAQKDFYTKTPFQRIENRNSLQKNLIKQKITNIKNKKFDFNINTNLIMKNLNVLENSKNIEKQIIASVKQNAESLEKAKLFTEKDDDNVSIYAIRPQGVSLKRYFSSKEKMLKKNSEISVEKFYKNSMKVKKIESSNILVIQDSEKSYSNFNSGKKSAKKLKSAENKNKTGADFIKKNLLAEANDNYNCYSSNNNKNINNNKVFKNQSTENTEYFFYHKQEQNNKNKNSELHNYFGYQKRPQTNILKFSGTLACANKRIVSSKGIGFSAEKKGFYVNRDAAEADSNGVVVVNRKHASLQYKDLSKEIQIIKVDRILLDKIKKF